MRDEDELDGAALAKLLIRNAWNGTLDDVKAAIAVGADARHVGSTGMTAVMQACIRHDDEGALAIVRYLVEECNAASMLRVAHNNGSTCLLYAARFGSLELVRYLLDRVPSIVNTLDLKRKKRFVWRMSAMRLPRN